MVLSLEDFSDACRALVLIFGQFGTAASTLQQTSAFALQCKSAARL
jgi:hypothetical protein